MGDNRTEEYQNFEWTNNVEMTEKICAFLFPSKKPHREELEDRVRITTKFGREIIQFDCDRKKQGLLCIYIGNPQKKNPRTAAILNGCRKLELRPRAGEFQRRAIITADGNNHIAGVLPLVIIMEDLEFHATI